MANQNEYCYKQMIRFSEMLMNNAADCRNERVIQFGYQAGRLDAMNQKENKTFTLIHKISAINIIKHGLSNIQRTDEQLISYGYAIGYLQDITKQSHEKWWKPITIHIQKNEWNIVDEICLNNVKDCDCVIDWKTIHSEIKIDN